MADKQVGDAIKLQAEFKVDGTLTDPTAVSLEVKDPSGNVDTYTYAGGTVTKSTTGTYYKLIALDEAGWWTYEWAGTGAVVAVEGNSFFVSAALI